MDRLDILPPWLLPGLLAALGILVGLWLARLRVRMRTARSRRLGNRGEKRARRLLARRGYRITELQTHRRASVEVDGEQVEFSVRIDAIVEREGERYIAEFKGGPKTGSVANRSTRRQLLEYAYVFGCDGILLVDADADAVLQVRFPGLGGGMPLPARA